MSEKNNLRQVPEITEEQRYNYLVEELKSIVIESVRISREEVIKGKWELGKRIVQEERNFERGAYGERTIKTLANDLGTSAVNLYKVIQFYKMYPKESFEDVIAELPFGNNCSWHKIVQNVLPQSREEDVGETEISQEDCEHNIVICKKCHKSFTFEDFLELAKKKNEEDK